MALVPSKSDKLKTGSKALEFKLKGVDGKEYSLSDFKDKSLLVIFMCNHCPYVIPKMDYFTDLQAIYSPNGLQVIAINSNDPTNYPADSFENMEKIAKEKRFNFPYLFDETQEVAKAYGATCTPDPFLFDQNQKLVYHGRFDDAHGKEHSKGTTSEMEDAIKQLLAGEKISVAQEPSLGCSIKWKQ